MRFIRRCFVSAGLLFIVASCNRVEPIVQVPPMDPPEVSETSWRSGDTHATDHSQEDEQDADEHPSGNQQLDVQRHSAPQPTAKEQHECSNNNEAALAIFERRILPIFQSTNASSCSECHLSGVDLKDYIRPTQQATFASLVGAKLIDMDDPDNSKILQFISRRPDQPSLLTDKVRQQEFKAFRAWICAAVSDSTLLADNRKPEAIGPQLPKEVIRHARKDRILASFIDNVWNEVGRCAACHSPDRNQKQVKEHGDQVSWITLRDPQATLNYMLEAGLVDADDPEKSLLLLKPTMQVKHGGGQKMVVGDRTYKQFRRFIDDYAAVVAGKYTKLEQIPEPNDETAVVTEIWLKIEDVPENFDKMLLQADLYRRTDSGWSPFRVATSDRLVFGKGRLWQHSLSLTAPRGTPWAEEIRSERLPPGRYLIKIYIDKAARLQQDFTAELREEDLVGQLEVESRWPAGYGKMTVVKFPEKS
jgi:mono/diheme cytochrome c family protein